MAQEVCGVLLHLFFWRSIITLCSQEKELDPPQPSPVRLSRLERARAEALHSFGGGSLGDIMDKAKKRVAKTLEVKGKEKDECCTDGDSTQELKQDDKENLVNSVTQS